MKIQFAAILSRSNRYGSNFHSLAQKVAVTSVTRQDVYRVHLCVVYICVNVKGVGRNFSGKGSRGFQGRVPQAIFSISRELGAQHGLLVASMVKMKEFRGQGVGIAPSHLAYACLRLL